MSETRELTLNRLSSSAVRRGSGRDWEEWLELLDRAGARDWDHKQIVAHLEREHPEVESGWWRQSITVGYEKARGKRVLGQTADAGFEVGVSRTFAAPPARVWEVIVARSDLWLGAGSLPLEARQPYRVEGIDGGTVEGEVRVVKPGDRIRMTWRPEGWAKAAVLQLSLSPTSSGKTALTAHMEKLPDAEAREGMRERLRRALEGLQEAAGPGGSG